MLLAAPVTCAMWTELGTVDSQSVWVATLGPSRCAIVVHVANGIQILAIVLVLSN